MLQNLNATKKGLITGLVMIGISLAFYFSGLPVNSPMQFIIYLLYAAGIIWSIYSFSRSEQNDNRFASYFLHGFKCFVVVTLLMVLFTFVFNKMHPEFKDQMTEAYKKEMEKTGNKTPAEIIAEADKMKNYYLPMLISSALFGYLLMGAVIAAVSSFLFIRRK